MAVGGPRKRIYSAAANLSLQGGGGQVSSPTIEATTTLADIQLNPSLGAVGVRHYPPNLQVAPSLPTVDVRHYPPDAQFAPSLGTVEVRHTPPNARFAFGASSVDVTSIPVAKDSWVDKPAGCVGAGGNNGGAAHLFIDGSIATKRDAYIGWDVSGFKAGMTVTSFIASGEVSQSPIGITNLVVSGWTISAANEGWTEGGIVCSNAPPLVAVGTNSDTMFAALNGGAAGDVVSFLGTATGRLALSNRLGVGTFTLGFSSASLNSGAVPSKENGAFSSISLRFTVEIPL